jgi:hypothetical protein
VQAEDCVAAVGRANVVNQLLVGFLVFAETLTVYNTVRKCIQFCFRSLFWTYCKPLAHYCNTSQLCLLGLLYNKTIVLQVDKI